MKNSDWSFSHWSKWLHSWVGLFEDLSSFPGNRDYWQWPNQPPKVQEKLGDLSFSDWNTYFTIKQNTMFLPFQFCVIHLIMSETLGYSLFRKYWFVMIFIKNPDNYYYFTVASIGPVKVEITHIRVAWNKGVWLQFCKLKIILNFFFFFFLGIGRFQ